MKPLSDVVILDLTHMLSGPFAGMLLADLGARTIKVEPPGKGELTRGLLAKDPNNSLNGMGAYFLTLNRNKESVCIDLKSDEGREVFYELVKKADIVVSNFSPGVTKRLQVHYDDLAKINPMITGQQDGPPTRAGIPIGDLGGGMFATVGMLTALHARTLTGKGQHIDISMQDCQLSLINYMGTMHFLSGEVPGPIGNSHFVHVPYNTYPTQDRWLIIAVITDAAWARLADMFGIKELIGEQYATQPQRLAAKEFIEGKITALLKTQSCDHWLEKMAAIRIPSAPVNDLAHAFSDEQVLARNMVVDVAHPEGGSVKMPGNPVKLSGTPAEDYAPPPLLGQHTDDVLKSLVGMSDDEIEKLKSQGAIA